MARHVVLCGECAFAPPGAP